MIVLIGWINLLKPNKPAYEAELWICECHLDDERHYSDHNQWVISVKHCYDVRQDSGSKQRVSQAANGSIEEYQNTIG